MGDLVTWWFCYNTAGQQNFGGATLVLSLDYAVGVNSGVARRVLNWERGGGYGGGRESKTSTTEAGDLGTESGWISQRWAR